MEASFLHLLMQTYGLKSLLIVGDPESAIARAAALAISENERSSRVGSAVCQLHMEEALLSRRYDLSYHMASYDLCLVAPHAGWLSSGKAAQLALACLRPRGWLILIRAVAAAHAFPVDVVSHSRNRQINALFRRLVSIDGRIHQSLRIGRVYAAQRVDGWARWPKRNPESTELRMRVVHAAMGLAAQDPDFRRALLDEPQTTLSILAAGRFGGECFPPDLFAGIIFHDSHHTLKTLQDVEHEHLHLITPAPVWHRPITEGELEALIKSAEQPFSELEKE